MEIFLYLCRQFIMIKKSAIIEKYLPISIGLIISVSVAIICKTCIVQTTFGNFVINICKQMTTQESLSLLVTVYSILFTGLLTFLGLFLQMNNDVMQFIKQVKADYIRLLTYIKCPIYASALSIVTSYLLYITRTHISSWILLMWGCLVVYSFISSIRLVYIYFSLIISKT